MLVSVGCAPSLTLPLFLMHEFDHTLAHHNLWKGWSREELEDEYQRLVAHALWDMKPWERDGMDNLLGWMRIRLLEHEFGGIVIVDDSAQDTKPAV